MAANATKVLGAVQARPRSGVSRGRTRRHTAGFPEPDQPLADPPHPVIFRKCIPCVRPAVIVPCVRRTNLGAGARCATSFVPKMLHRNGVARLFLVQALVRVS